MMYLCLYVHTCIVSVNEVSALPFCLFVCVFWGYGNRGGIDMWTVDRFMCNTSSSLVMELKNWREAAVTGTTKSMRMCLYLTQAGRPGFPSTVEPWAKFCSRPGWLTDRQASRQRDRQEGRQGTSCVGAAGSKNNCICVHATTTSAMYTFLHQTVRDPCMWKMCVCLF